jgi:CRP-like cAMP-binding protein
MPDRLELMSAMPVFGGLDAEALDLMTNRGRSVTLDVGQHFFREGDETQAMYVLLTGRVEIYKSWQGESKLLRWMEAGDCFGEMALIDLFPRSASALATEHCEALEITPPVLREVYAHNPEQFTLMQMNMSREISRRLRRVDELLFRALMGDPLPETTFHDYS